MVRGESGKEAAMVAFVKSFLIVWRNRSDSPLRRAATLAERDAGTRETLRVA